MDLLQTLTQVPSVPGREDRVRAVIQQAIEERGLFDEIRTDPMGSLIAVRRPRPATDSRSDDRPIRVVLMAHMDQIGFLVRHVDSNGYLRVNPVGGFDARNLFSRGVRVCTDSGDYPGMMNAAGRPVHIASPEDRKKIPEVTEFFVDCGMSGVEASEKIRIGDMVVLDGPFREVGHSVISQCLDNRVGCWAVIRALESLQAHNCEIHVVWSVQEEVGCRGAGPSAFAIEPDVAVACDTTLCCTTPGIPEEDRVTVAGDGISLHVMDSSMISDLGLIREFEVVAAANNINCQRAILPRGGQDGSAIQRSRSGVRTISLACPIKYIHTVNEMAHRDDLDSYHRLLTAWLHQL